MAKEKKSHQNEMMNPYEMERKRRIESNIALLKAKGIKNVVNKVLQDKYEKFHRAQEDDMDCQLEAQEVTKKMNCSQGTKRKYIVTGAMSMEESAQLQGEQHKKPSQEKYLPSNRSSNLQIKTNFCAPGSMAKSASVKKMQALRGQRSNGVHPTNIVESDSSEDAPGTNTRYENMRRNQTLRGGQRNDLIDSHIQSGDLPLDDRANFLAEAENNQNEVSNALVVNGGNENASDIQVKKHRGKTILGNIHTRTNCDPIILNDKNQPVGPTTEIVSTFTRFLGTLARDSNYAPLNYIDWRKVPTKIKDKIWDYVQVRRKNTWYQKKENDGCWQMLVKNGELTRDKSRKITSLRTKPWQRC